MYTVIWMEKGQDKWDRLKTKKRSSGETAGN